MKKPNEEIRQLAQERGVFLWQIAQILGIADSTLYRQLRTEFAPDYKKKVLHAIEKAARR